MNFRLLQTTDAEYAQMKALRLEVLLRPIGIPASYMDEKKEQQDLLLAGFAGPDLVCCCILTLREPGTFQLRQMAVSEAIQRSGIGSRLVHFAESIARERGVHKIILHARDTVIPFYKTLGYEISGDGFEEVSIPHHQMEKELS